MLLFVLGACFGSFLCCQARRLRIKELATETSQKSSSNTKKSKKTGKRANSLGSRSVCLHCKKQIKWYDNIPLVSWLVLRGKCRFCHRKIGLLEPLSELGLALAFLLTGLNFDPLTSNLLAWLSFLLSVIFVCLLGFLAIYDGAYSELPTIILLSSIVCAVALTIVNQTQLYLNSTWTPDLLLVILGSVAILGGTYLVLYLISKGKWVGDGDWLLGIALGTALANPWLALINLCLANFLACLVTLPKYRKNLKVPLGPFLIIAFIVVYSFQNFFLNLL